MSEITESKNITFFEEVIIGYKCSNCMKVVMEENLPNNWHRFSSQHHEWGNDSCDSYELYHVCSPECYFELLKNEIKNNKEYDSFKINDISLKFVMQIINYIKGLKNV